MAIELSVCDIKQQVLNLEMITNAWVDTTACRCLGDSPILGKKKRWDLNREKKTPFRSCLSICQDQTCCYYTQPPFPSNISSAHFLVLNAMHRRMHHRCLLTYLCPPRWQGLQTTLLARHKGILQMSKQPTRKQQTTASAVSPSQLLLHSDCGLHVQAEHSRETA